MWLKDIHGKEYLDCQAGLANCNFGHGNEEVAQAAYDQMRQLQFTTSGNGLASKPLIELSAKLGQMLSPDLTRILVMSGGSEVNEAAIKLSRYLNRLEGRPEKHKVISRKLAYHGSTVGTVPTTDVLTFAQAASPLPPGYLKIDPPDSYRCSFCNDQPKCNLECARRVGNDHNPRGARDGCRFHWRAGNAVRRPVSGGWILAVDSGNLRSVPSLPDNG